jgi:diketogulonate reductase-like aldo/keto reductase
MERLLAERRVRAIGVSNFYEQDLRPLLADASVVPAVNQIELHPWCSQSAQRALNAEFGIATEAWGPLGRGRGLLDCAQLGVVAARHGRSRAQVVLRWHMQLGAVVIPKSTDPVRMARNLDLFDFVLDENDLKVMSTLDQGRLVGPVARPF